MRITGCSASPQSLGKSWSERSSRHLQAVEGKEKKKGAEPVLEEKVGNVVYRGFNKVFDIVSHSVLIAILVISGLKM